MSSGRPALPEKVSGTATYKEILVGTRLFRYIVYRLRLRRRLREIRDMRWVQR